jgi:hypothetical protein
MIGRGRMDKESCKFEARNPKFKTISNYQNSESGKKGVFGTFEYSNLGFVSDFDIRISDF